MIHVCLIHDVSTKSMNCLLSTLSLSVLLLLLLCVCVYVSAADPRG